MEPIDLTEIYEMYENKCIAVDEKNEVFFSGDTMEEVYEEALRQKRQIFFVNFIPPADISIAL